MFRTDDPLADFNRWDTEQQKRLDRLPRCRYCGEPIQGEHVYVFDGKCTCEDCLNEYHRISIDRFIQ